MINLLIDGKGILGEQEGIFFRQALDMDRLDFSTDPIRVLFSQSVENTSVAFGLNFLGGSAYRVFSGEVPWKNTHLYQLKEEYGVSPSVLGPYSFAVEGITEQASILKLHNFRNAIGGLYNIWEVAEMTTDSIEACDAERRRSFRLALE